MRRDQASRANTEDTPTRDEIATTAIGAVETDSALLVLLLAELSSAVCVIVDGSEPSIINVSYQKMNLDG